MKSISRQRVSGVRMTNNLAISGIQILMGAQWVFRNAIGYWHLGLVCNLTHKVSQNNWKTLTQKECASLMLWEVARFVSSWYTTSTDKQVLRWCYPKKCCLWLSYWNAKIKLRASTWCILKSILLEHTIRYARLMLFSICTTYLANPNHSASF